MRGPRSAPADSPRVLGLREDMAYNAACYSDARYLLREFPDCRQYRSDAAMWQRRYNRAQAAYEKATS
jgi:hypothetical protein